MIPDEAALWAHTAAFRRRLDMARELVAEHLDACGGYVSWSGGKDSTVCLLVANDVRPGTPTCWFDSGLEFPENRTYIQETALSRGVRLDVIAAAPDALTWLVQSGEWEHGGVDRNTVSLHDALITIPACVAADRYGDGHILGLRADESAQRRRTAMLHGTTMWSTQTGSQGLTPLAWWTERDVWAAHVHYSCLPNPLYRRLADLGCDARSARVGLIIDGNGLNMGRARWLRRGWPTICAELERALPLLRAQ